MKTVNMPPLKYSVSSLSQLPQCLSNNSRQLHIHTSQFLNNNLLVGTKVEVVHDELGILYCKIFDMCGQLVSNLPISTEDEKQEKKQFLRDLEKFGFYIQYNSFPLPTKEQLNYLRTFRNMGYDKFRLLNVYHLNEVRDYIYEQKLVGFKSGKCPKWLQNTYTCSITEFKNVLAQGYAINLSSDITNDKPLEWSWLEGIIVSVEDLEKEIESNGTIRVEHGEHNNSSNNVPPVKPHSSHSN